jgi:hypothetical protein
VAVSEGGKKEGKMGGAGEPRWEGRGQNGEKAKEK